MKFAFLILGQGFNSKLDRAAIRNDSCQIIGVSSISDACSVAKELVKENITCIELCGAFLATGAKAIIDATENKVPVGFVTHLEEQDDLFLKTFGK